MATGQRTRTAEERLERLLRLQALPVRVAHELHPALELQGVLTTVLGAVRTMVDIDGGTIQLVDERGLLVAAAEPPITAGGGDRVPMGAGLSGRVVLTGDVVYSPDLLTDDRVDPLLRADHEETPTRSYLAVPLVVLGSAIGVLQIDSVVVDAFDLDDRALLEGLAIQVSAAIEGAQRREELLEVERMKGDFIARISHELRTPLTVIGGFTDTLLLHGDRLDPNQQREVLGRIKTSVSRLASLIEEILTVSSLDAGMSRVKPERVELAPLLREAAKLSLDESRVTVECDDDRRLVTDPVILRHLVNQLVDNALKYGGDAVVAVESSDDGRTLVIVRDHGPGIAEADRHRVFQRFYRGNHTGAGMGLGLPVVRQLAASLDATVVLDDAPEGGARFTLRFERA